MENKQSPQQQSSELNASRLTRSKSREARSTGANTLLKILKHYPWLIWGGVWLLLITSAAIAAFSLTNIGHVEAGPTPAPIAAEKPENSHSSSMPLWLLGAVAFTFAAGMVISKQLNRSSPPRRLRQRTRRFAALEPTHRREPRRRLKERPSVPTPIQPSPAETESVVIVPLTQENQAHTPTSESLAEMMDIRKHRSLDSILRKL